MSLSTLIAGDMSTLAIWAELGNKERTLLKLLLLAVTGWDEDKKWGCSLRKCQPDVIFPKSFEKETFSEYV